MNKSLKKLLSKCGAKIDLLGTSSGDKTVYITGSDTKQVLPELTEITKQPFEWLEKNQMKANFSKYHLPRRTSA